MGPGPTERRSWPAIPRGGQATLDEIRRATRNDLVEVLVAQLSSQASIRALVAAFRREHDGLDVLVNCAGAFFRERRLTVDGLEMTFALNHLASGHRFAFGA